MKKLNEIKLNQKESEYRQQQPMEEGKLPDDLSDPVMAKNKKCGWRRDICQGIIMAYFLMMALIYPFYAPGGYMRIGEVKYEFFRNISLVTVVVLLAVILLSIFVCGDRGWIIRNYRQMSVTDWFAYGYLMAVMLSYLFSVYKEDALWGVDGWYMGVITQMIFVLLYFFFSRYFHSHSGWIGVWLSAVVLVFLLGICNRYSIYPIAMEGQTETFISTLGNINWFCGYWSVTAPIGIALYWCSDKTGIRILTGIYSVIAMVSGVTQGSNSAYLVFIAVFFILLVLSLRSNEKLYRFLELWMMFAAACLLAKVMCDLPDFQYNYGLTADDEMSRIALVLLDGNAAVWMFSIVFICYVLFRLLDKRGFFHIERHRWMWGIMIVAVVMVAGIAVLLLLLDSGALYFREVPATVEYDGSLELVFDEDWGNGRGAAWNCGIDAYQSMDTLHKIVGIGPDCFADYVYEVPELAHRLADQFVNQRLTNAHNEQLTLMINVGVLGWLCYMGIFLTAFVRYVRGARRQSLLYLCAISIAAYIAHNMVSFQQVLNAPYVFIVLGIGEKFYRDMISGKQTDERNA